MIRAKAPGTDDNAPRGVMKIKARAGDTIAGLAARYNVSADEMARLNGRAVDAQLEAGFEVKVPSTQPASTRRRSR
jgi:LysM repeat protein